MLRTSSSSLFGDLDVEFTPDAPVGTQTWYGIGGSADVLLRPRTIEALKALAKRCRRARTPLRVLGAGANLLVGDEGVGGVVLKLDMPELKAIEYDTSRGAIRMKAMAGADMAKTLMDATRRGYGGLQQMAGIPATVGGAIRMNAGGAFGSIGDAVESVTCVNKSGDLVTYPTSELRFEYRHTNIPDPIILSATFRLAEEDPIKLRARVKEIFAFKKSTQPLAESSAGCTFKNPIDPVTGQRVPAGKLIDEAGLKGSSVGGASVSDQHANFIVTRPGALAQEVISLLELIKQRVFDDAGIELETEVVIWRRGALDT